ncbi:MAG: zf-HC2 domain-containing protein [bacterium]
MTQLTCSDVVAFLMSYLSRERASEPRAEFEAHLSMCDECVAFVRSYELTMRLSQAAFDDLDDAAEEHVPRSSRPSWLRAVGDAP